jgi:Septum formation initiator
MLRRRTVTLLALAGLLAVLQAKLWLGEGGVLDLHRLQHAVAVHRAADRSQVRTNAALQADIDELQNGGDAVQARARNDLGMVKDGETFYLIVHPNS